MPSSARTASSARAAISGIATQRDDLGQANQRSRTVALTHGVAIEISTRPPTIGGQAMLAPLDRRSCSSPSVFMTSQVAPIST